MLRKLPRGYSPYYYCGDHTFIVFTETAQSEEIVNKQQNILSVSIFFTHFQTSEKTILGSQFYIPFKNKQEIFSCTIPPDPNLCSLVGTRLISRLDHIFMNPNVVPSLCISER